MAIKKIVKGNDFTLRIPVAKIVNGEKVPYPLPACEELTVKVCNAFKRVELMYSIDAEEDNVLIVPVSSDMLAVGRYALEVSGKIFGNKWRSSEYPQFQIVSYNADADTEFGETDEGDNSVEMDTAIVFLPPSVDLSEAIKEASNVDADIEDYTLTITNRKGEKKSVKIASSDEIDELVGEATKATAAAKLATELSEQATQAATQATLEAKAVTVRVDTATESAVKASESSQKASETAQEALEAAQEAQSSASSSARSATNAAALASEAVDAVKESASQISGFVGRMDSVEMSTNNNKSSIDSLTTRVDKLEKVPTGGSKIVALSQAEYDSIEEKETDTCYMIYED